MFSLEPIPTCCCCQKIFFWFTLFINKFYEFPIWFLMQREWDCVKWFSVCVTFLTHLTKIWLFKCKFIIIPQLHAFNNAVFIHENLTSLRCFKKELPFLSWMDNSTMPQKSLPYTHFTENEILSTSISSITRERFRNETLCKSLEHKFYDFFDNSHHRVINCFYGFECSWLWLHSAMIDSPFARRLDYSHYCNLKICVNYPKRRKPTAPTSNNRRAIYRWNFSFSISQPRSLKFC